MGTVAARRPITSRSMSRQYRPRAGTPSDDTADSWVGAVLESMSEAVVIVDKRGEVVRANSAYNRMFDTSLSFYSATDASGNFLAKEEMPEQRAAGDAPFAMEFIITAADGMRRWFEARGQPLRDRQGRRC